MAARGLDIPAVEHVIHYQVPKDPDVCSNLPVGVGWGCMVTLRLSRVGLNIRLCSVLTPCYVWLGKKDPVSQAC